MVVYIPASSFRMRFLDKENMCGQTGKHTRVNGLKTKCMEMVIFVGKMGSSTAVSSKMISGRVKVHLHGEMVVSIRVSGVTESSMVRECSLNLMGIRERVCGRMEEILNGLTNEST